MLIFAIDDEPAVLENLHDAIVEAVPDAEVGDYMRAETVLEAVKAGLRPDVVFSDIRMPDMDGLELAAAIRKMSPDTCIIFVTAYSQYALDAWKQHVQGYLVKPVIAEDIRETLAHLPLRSGQTKENGAAENAGETTAKRKGKTKDLLQVHCFGRFEVFLRGEPIIFERKQSKELLAFLIDCEGTACTAEEIMTAMWEDETNKKAAMARIRRILSDLKSTLKKYGADDVLVREHRQIAIRRDLVDCDYYRMLDGDPEAISSYQGEYMIQYSWAEMTAARLQFQYLE